MDEETRALVIEMRRYIRRRDLLLGECVAWQALKERYGVKTITIADDEEWARSWRDQHPIRNSVRFAAPLVAWEDGPMALHELEQQIARGYKLGLGPYTAGVDWLGALLNVCREHGSSVTLYWDKDTDMWICTWMTGQRRIIGTGPADAPQIAVARALQDALPAHRLPMVAHEET